MFNPSQMREMLSSAKEMGQQMQEKMEQISAEASSGGGMVTARVNGKRHLLSLKIEPAAVNPADIEMLQDLVLAAVNEAGRQAEEQLKQSMGGMLGGLGGLNLPGMQ
jgi:DNA-binding YbaB/EbfC family protein